MYTNVELVALRLANTVFIANQKSREHAEMRYTVYSAWITRLLAIG